MSGQYNKTGTIRTAALLALLTLIGLQTSCRDENKDGSASGRETAPVRRAPDKHTVALVDSIGNVTTGHIDRYILSMPAASRNPGDSPFEEWYGEIVQKFSLDQIFLNEAEKRQLGTKENFAKKARVLRRMIYSDFRLNQELAKAPEITKEEIKKLYEERKGNFTRPERRFIYHIFLNFNENTPSTKKDVLTKLEDLRVRAENGENFGLLAMQFSESESRVRQGLIGEIVRDQLPSPANEIIFSLEEGKVSEPVIVGNGAHLFYNENTIAGRDFTFEEARPQLLASLTSKRAGETLQRMADECEVSENSFLPGDEEVTQKFKSENPDEKLLGIGTFELLLKDFRLMVRELRARPLSPYQTRPSPMDIYRELKNREILFQDMLTGDLPQRENLEELYSLRKDELLVKTCALNLMTHWLKEHPDILLSFYQNHSKRFQTPPGVHLEGIRIEIDDGAPAKMKQLEASREQLERGEIKWSDLADRVGGKYSDWGWLTPAEAKVNYFREAKVAFGMSEGEVSAPYSTGKELRIFEVVETEKSEPIPFEVSRPRVIDQYLASNSPEIYNELSRELLEEYGVVFFPENYPSLFLTSPSTPHKKGEEG